MMTIGLMATTIVYWNILSAIFIVYCVTYSMLLHWKEHVNDKLCLGDARPKDVHICIAGH